MQTLVVAHSSIMVERSVSIRNPVHNNYRFSDFNARIMSAPRFYSAGGRKITAKQHGTIRTFSQLVHIIATYLAKNRGT